MLPWPSYVIWKLYPGFTQINYTVLFHESAVTYNFMNDLIAFQNLHVRTTTMKLIQTATMKRLFLVFKKI